MAMLACLLALVTCREADASSFMPPRRPLSDDDLAALGALHKTILIARVVDGVAGLESIGSGRSTRTEFRRILRIQVIESLKGRPPAGLIEVEFGSHAGGSPPNEVILRLQGKLVLLFLHCRDARCYIVYGPHLPERGIAIVHGPRDPWVERTRKIIARGGLDSLIARAEVICVGYSPLVKTLRNRLVIQDWIAGPARQDTLEVFWPFSGIAGTGPVLAFLGRNGEGKLEPLDMGAGQFEVEDGQVARLNQALADVVRQIRARRFVHEARFSGERTTTPARATHGNPRAQSP